MQAHGTITERDFLQAQYVHARRPRLSVLIVSIPISMLCLFEPARLMFAGKWLAHLEDVLVLVAGVSLAYLQATYLLYLPWRSKRIYQRNRASFADLTVEVLGNGLHITSRLDSSTVSWNQIQKLRRNTEMILLYIAKGRFLIIPAHFFASDKMFFAFVAAIEGYLENAA